MTADDSKEAISAPGAKVPRQIQSRDLFREGEREVWILHGDASYRLQLTKNGKLILTK